MRLERLKSKTRLVFTFLDCNLTMEICMEALNLDEEMSTCQTIFDRRLLHAEPALVVNYLIGSGRMWVMLGFESHILLLVA